MSKAYDRIEWAYLQRIIVKMRFSTTWINLVITIVTTVSYSFLVKGIPRGYLMPTSELCQGDPLSLYLFLLCAKGLSALIARKEQTGRLQGISIGNGAPFVNHLLFADDSYLFTRATEDDYKEVADTLPLYERASGQMVILHKSEVCFSRNVKCSNKAKLAAIMGVKKLDRTR